MKKVLLFLGALLLFGMLCACSNSDDANGVFEGQPSTEQSEDENNQKNVEMFLQGTSDDIVDFQLQNEDGKECYDYKEGENIIFKLEFKNDTDEDAYVTRFYEMIGWDGLRVYSLYGEDMGTPWDEIVATSQGYDYIGAHSSVVILCPWFDIPALYCNEIEHWYSHMYYKKKEKSPLPKGEYYSRFYIQFNDKTITCNRNFIIR